MAEGNIENCFLYFPQFRVDYSVLENTGIIKRHGRNSYYEWTKSKTSLAQYFKWSICFTVDNTEDVLNGGVYKK
jgi:hypothetical protein